jgi:NADH-quinone oxidoreductase subunit F
MDLKIASARATDAERDAVDALLGPPVEVAHHVARGGEVLREQRHLLLPALHAVNDRIGWISRGAINHIAQRLDVAPAEIYGVASFYALFALDERPPRQVHVCVDLACRAAGGPNEHDLPVGTHPSPCLGTCERAPATLVIEAGARPRRAVVAPASAADVERAAGGAWPGDEAPVVTSVPQVADGDSSLVLLRRIGRIEPTSLDDYRATGGYEALRRAFAIGPSAVIREVTDAGLVGRGGAAFPTGRPGADRGRPVRADRVDDDRRVRDRMRARLGVPAR